jgi:23S rRNA (cytosine1962-C5)-methyltransferase
MTVNPARASDPRVVISARGEERLRGGHLWIYRADVADAQAGPGEIVRIVGPRGRFVGRGLYSDRSQIALRLLTTVNTPIDRAFWRDRLAGAIGFRRTLGIDATAYRLVHGEGDLLPSLIVDRYADVLVVQALSQGMDRLLPELTEILLEVAEPSAILARNDPRVRLLEGLEQRVDVLYGTVPQTITVREGAAEYEVDPWRGQKTGLFLDQRENRQAAAQYARGRLLDCFSYTGGFAVQLAPRCAEVTALDISEPATAALGRNAAMNGLTNVHARTVNVFDELRALERAGERFDTVVLDPPAFAKNKASIPNALAGYREINLRALKLLAPGGCLVTCSCSYNVDEGLFAGVLHEAAADARTQVTLVEKRMQGRDHPVLIGMPETYYLKCLILRKPA